jgi:hypothetical protein
VVVTQPLSGRRGERLQTMPFRRAKQYRKRAEGETCGDYLRADWQKTKAFFRKNPHPTCQSGVSTAWILESSHQGNKFMKFIQRMGWLAAVLLTGTLLAGCIDSTYSRGLFQGYVIDQTQEVVVDKIGKPESEEKSGEAVKWVYKKKTFDPDNMNAFDAITTIIFQPDPVSKKLVAMAVQFS